MVLINDCHRGGLGLGKSAVLTAFILVIGLTGCGWAGRGSEPVPLVEIQRQPWDLWEDGRDLTGMPLSNESLRRGDEAWRLGLMETAMEHYLAAETEFLSRSEQEALLARFAGMRLSSGDGPGARNLLRAYFMAQGSRAEDLDPVFGLQYAYAYIQVKEYEQALAWFALLHQFSRAGASSDRAPQIQAAVNQGVKSMLLALPEPQVRRLGERFKGDPFLALLLQQELQRRSAAVVERVAAIPATEKLPIVAEAPPIEPVAGPAADLPAKAPAFAAFKMVGLLPLSGPAAGIGADLKNGMELAVAGLLAPGAAAPLFIDTQGNPEYAAEQLQKVRELEKPDAIVAHMPPVAEGLPYDNIWPELRLVLTQNIGSAAESTAIFPLSFPLRDQISSLTRALSMDLKLSRWGIIYPKNADGFDFYYALKTILAEQNLALLFEQAVDFNETGALAGVVPLIAEQNPEVLFLPAVGSGLVAQLQQLPAEKRRGIWIAGVSDWCEQPAVSAVLPQVAGLIAVCPVMRDTERPDVLQFLSAYEFRFGRKAGAAAALGFDAATLAFQLQGLLAQEKKSLLEALRRLGTYQGLTAAISLQPDSSLRRRIPVAVYTESGSRELS